MKIENISDLWVLLHTARTGSLTGAAAASATLKRLETQLHTRLFERSIRAMHLTPQGQTLLEYATRAFELVAEGAAQVTADRVNIVGTIRVTAPSDLTRAVLLPWIDEFILENPGVHIALSVSDRTLDVVRDEVDVAIRYGELADSRLVARRLLDARPIVTRAWLPGTPPRGQNPSGSGGAQLSDLRPRWAQFSGLEVRPQRRVE